MQLETKRLILRKPKKSDANILDKNTDVIAIKDFFMPYPKKKGDFEKLINTCIKEWETKKRYWFILELKETKEIIGLSGVKNINNYNKTGYLSSWIFKRYRRNGYLTEAKIAITNFCFKELNLRKLKSEVASFNKASISLQSKFGMKKEGISKKENYNPYLKKYADMVWFALFKEDWKKIKPKIFL
jgi:RimJ/RimL family protein N-acetyltransferase